MKIQEKPDYLIFADSAKNGECTNFPDVSRGWGVTIDQTASKPPLEWMNGAFNRIDKNMLYLLQQGVPEWSEHVIYPANAIIKYNGVLYTATVKNDNAIPTTSNKWKKTNPEIADASETNKGIVKLNSAINSTSETEAATPKAVKAVYDSLNGSVKKSGDTMTGQLILPKEGLKINFDNKDVMAIVTANDNYSHVFYNSEKKQWLSKLVYNSTTNVWNFQYVDDVTINNKSILKNGDAIQTFGDLSTTLHLNDLTGLNEGVYYQARNALAVTERGYPIGEAGTLQVFKNGADGAGCCQIYTTYRNARQFIRNYRGGTKTWEEWSEVITTANVDNFLPVGIPQPWPTTTPPDGWLKCNGWKFDKNKYPKLAQVYPSGYLPDLRGEFIRGWDDGKGTDTGRGILSWQEDAIRNIWGELETFVTGATNSSNSAGVFRTTVNSWPAYQPAAQGGGTHQKLTLDASTQVPTTHENRPRNLAFMYILKAE